MKIKKGFELRDICGEKVVMATGIENVDFCRMISFNESAAYLWQAVGNSDFNADTLAELLRKEYEVDETTALADAKQIMADWTKSGIVE